MTVVICGLSSYTVQLVVSVGIKEEVKDYEQLMDKLFGFPGYTFILGSLFIYDYGAMLSYLIILGDVCTMVARQISIEWLGVADEGCFRDEWCLRRICILVPSIFIILPLCFLRDISRLEKVSSLSVYVTVFIIVVVIIASFSEHNQSVEPWLTGIGSNPAAAFGVFAFAFVCHDTAFMFFGSLRNPTATRWRKTAFLSLAISFVICLAFALPGYAAFREHTQGNILNNFSASDAKIIAVRLLFMLTMSFTYPICFFICRHIINEMLYRFEQRNTPRIPGTPAGLSIKDIPSGRHRALTLVLFSSSVVLCLFIKDLGLVMSLTGNISAVSIAFIMPPLCALKSRYNRLLVQHGVNQPLLNSNTNQTTFLRSVWNIKMTFQAILLVFGVTTTIFCTWQTITNR